MVFCRFIFYDARDLPFSQEVNCCIQVVIAARISEKENALRFGDKGTIGVPIAFEKIAFFYVELFVVGIVQDQVALG